MGVLALNAKTSMEMEKKKCLNYHLLKSGQMYLEKQFLYKYVSVTFY